MNAPRVDQPQPGYYKTKLVRGGPWVPARIWWEPPLDPVTGELLDRPPMLLAERAGKPVDPYELWPHVAGREISEAEYRYLVDDAAWCQEWAPHEPQARPRERVDLNELQPLF